MPYPPASLCVHCHKPFTRREIDAHERACRAPKEDSRVSQTKWKLITRERGPIADVKIIAPAGCDFDATSAECWFWLLVKSRENKFRLKRDKIINDAKIEMLSQVLGNSNGMSTFYWTMIAREAVAEECRLRDLSYAVTSPQ